MLSEACRAESQKQHSTSGPFSRLRCLTSAQCWGRCQILSISSKLQQGLLLTCWKHSHWRHISLASQEELSCLVRHQGRLWCEFHHTLIHNHQSQLRDGKRSFYRVATAGSLLETELMPTKTKHFNEDSTTHHITQGHSHPQWEHMSGFMHFWARKKWHV